MQAYYMNDTFYAGPESEAPIYMFIGGEGPLRGSSVTDNFIVDLLPDTQGLMFAVEHRYYGCIRNMSSCPYDNSTDAHLQYLSSRQALADLASFHAFATHKYQLRPKAKWVAVGGSYPGMLAGFVRAEYPNLFHSAIASSAPVHGKLDMASFEDIVSSAYALDAQGIEGSPACRDAIAAGHVSVGELLADDVDMARLAQLFPTGIESAEWLADPANQRAFAGCGVASFPAQANKPTCADPGCGIKQICSIMTNESLGTPLQRLAELRMAQDSVGANMVSSCEMDWEMPGDVPGSMEEVSANLFWGYQTCTEFGFYQTCEHGSNCFFTQGLVSFTNPDHRPNGFCSELFGISTNDTEAMIARTDADYTSSVALATRIIWVNGNVDPWYGQSYLESPGTEQPTIWPVEGARHCAWMSSAQESDQESVRQARREISEQMSAWLNADDGDDAMPVDVYVIAAVALVVGILLATAAFWYVCKKRQTQRRQFLLPQAGTSLVGDQVA